MKTYNSYEEAKIANPESDIYVNNTPVFGVKHCMERMDHQFYPCDVEDYCVTYNQCDEFKSGMVVMDLSGVMKINYEVAKSLNTHKASGAINSDWDECFILRAVALKEEQGKTEGDFWADLESELNKQERPKPFLQTGEEFEHTKTLNFIYDRMSMFGESPNLDYMHKLKNAIAFTEDRESPCNQAAAQEKPKRTKVEYVECDNLQGSLDKFESMSGFEFYPDENGVGDRINSVRYLALAYGNNSLYRRIETEITERNEFIEFVESKCSELMVDGEWSLACIAADLFDSGKIKFDI